MYPPPPTPREIVTSLIENDLIPALEATESVPGVVPESYSVSILGMGELNVMIGGVEYKLTLYPLKAY